MSAEPIVIEWKHQGDFEVAVVDIYTLCVGHHAFFRYPMWGITTKSSDIATGQGGQDIQTAKECAEALVRVLVNKKAFR